jgi:hypothetical protein
VRSEQGQSTFPTRKQALSRPRVVKMSGTSAAQLRVGSLRNKTTYDLRGFVSTAYREEVTSYPLSFGSQEATSGLAIIGGEVLGGNPRDWTWQQWEDMSEVGGAPCSSSPTVLSSATISGPITSSICSSHGLRSPTPSS